MSKPSEIAAFIQATEHFKECERAYELCPAGSGSWAQLRKAKRKWDAASTVVETTHPDSEDPDLLNALAEGFAMRINGH